MDQTLENGLIKRLDVVISIMLNMVTVGNRPLNMRQKILFLKDLGLRPIEIAKMLGRSVNYVTKEISTSTKSHE